MINTASKLMRALCSMAVMLALAAGIAAIPVFAASHGIYTAAATSHYRHPTTGVIEDSGGEGSYVLGQSMTDSALNKSALVEVDASGNTWVTIRLNLMDNIQSPQFQVDGSRNGKFSSVTATVMQEDFTENTTDFRMQVPDENAIIRCNMYVVPMGREVVFYITVGSLKAGSGDFVTSITVPSQEEPSAQSSAASSSESHSSSNSQSSNSSQSSSSSSQPESSAAPSASPSPSPSPSESSLSSQPETSAAVSSAAGLAEFDAAGNEVSNASTEAGQDSSTGNPVIWWVIGGIVMVAIAGGCVWYFCFFRKGKNPFQKK